MRAARPVGGRPRPYRAVRADPGARWRRRRLPGCGCVNGFCRSFREGTPDTPSDLPRHSHRVRGSAARRGGWATRAAAAAPRRCDADPGWSGAVVGWRAATAEPRHGWKAAAARGVERSRGWTQLHGDVRGGGSPPTDSRDRHMIDTARPHTDVTLGRLAEARERRRATRSVVKRRQQIAPRQKRAVRRARRTVTASGRTRCSRT